MLDGYELNNHVVDFNYFLLDVNRYSEEGELLNLTNLISAVFLLDQRVNPDMLRDRLGKLIGIFKNLTLDEFILLKRWFTGIIKKRECLKNCNLGWKKY